MPKAKATNPEESVEVVKAPRPRLTVEQLLAEKETLQKDKTGDSTTKQKRLREIRRQLRSQGYHIRPRGEESASGEATNTEEVSNEMDGVEPEDLAEETNDEDGEEDDEF